MRKLLCQSDLADLPQFLRFDDVELNYCCKKVPIKEKCQLAVNYLQPIKKALNGLNLITFIGKIDENYPTGFIPSLKSTIKIGSFSSVCIFR